MLPLRAAAWLVSVPAQAAGKKARAAEDQPNTLVLDVAFNGQTLNYSRFDAIGAGPVRGDTFIITGKVYPGGTIPDGDTTFTFAPDSDGSVGSIVCTGMYTADATAIAAGEPCSFPRTICLCWIAAMR